MAPKRKITVSRAHDHGPPRSCSPTSKKPRPLDEFSPVKDWQSPQLEVWQDAEARRGDNKQGDEHPQNAIELWKYLDRIWEFREETLFILPDYSYLCHLLMPDTPWEWTWECSRQLRILAHCTGIVFPLLPEPDISTTFCTSYLFSPGPTNSDDSDAVYPLLPPPSPASSTGSSDFP